MMDVRAKYGKFPVAVQLLLPLISIFLGLWTAGTLGFGYFARQQLERNVVNEIEEIASVVKRSLHQEQKLLRSQARWVADQEDVVKAFATRDRATLLRILLPIQASLKLDLIKALDPNDQVLLSLQQDALNQVQLEDTQASKAASIGFELSDVIHAKAVAPSSIADVTTIKSQHKILGGLIVGVAISDELLLDLRTSRDKHIIALRGSQVVASTLPDAKTAAWSIPSSNSATQRVAIAQTEYFAKSVILTGDSDAKLTIVVLQSTESLQTAERNLWILVAGFGVFGTGIVAIVALVGNRVAHRLTKRLRDLTAATQQIADGNFRDRIPVESYDEIGTLTQSFNVMSEQLIVRDQKIQSQMQQLEKTLRKLKQTQAQLVQSEKMSSLGQLVAGIAHEINNPINFIHGNIQYARQYFGELMALLNLYQQEYPAPSKPIQEALEEIDLDFLNEDITKIFHSMEMGTTRVETIVLSLRSFSRLDESALKSVNIHEGLESTLLVLQSRLAKIQVVKDYGELPLVECYAGKLNQVFLNILGNAIDALETANQPCIQIRTYQPQPGWIGIAIADNGSGIQPEIETKLFDPFFTTKPVGKGTGLGLSISYQIIVNEHEGTLLCHSTPQSGAEFVIEIPVQQSGSG